MEQVRGSHYPQPPPPPPRQPPPPPPEKEWEFDLSRTLFGPELEGLKKHISASGYEVLFYKDRHLRFLVHTVLKKLKVDPSRIAVLDYINTVVNCNSPGNYEVYGQKKRKLSGLKYERKKKLKLERGLEFKKKTYRNVIFIRDIAPIKWDTKVKFSKFYHSPFQQLLLALKLCLEYEVLRDDGVNVFIQRTNHTMPKVKLLGNYVFKGIQETRRYKDFLKKNSVRREQIINVKRGISVSEKKIKPKTEKEKQKKRDYKKRKREQENEDADKLLMKLQFTEPASFSEHLVDTVGKTMNEFALQKGDLYVDVPIFDSQGNFLSLETFVANTPFTKKEFQQIHKSKIMEGFKNVQTLMLSDTHSIWTSDNTKKKPILKEARTREYYKQDSSDSDSEPEEFDWSQYHTDHEPPNLSFLEN